MHATRTTLSVSLVLSVLMPAVSLHADGRLVRLRPVDAVARGVLEVGRERSELFHSLADRVDRSDVIVYISTSNSLPNGVDGRLQLVAVVSKVRYLLITIRRDLTADRLVAMLGHELMHAVEVAEDRAVVDNDSLRRLYARIGHSHDSETFDTQAAVDAGHRVLAEIRTNATRRITVDLKH